MKSKLKMRRETLVTALMVLFIVSIIPVLADEGTDVDLTATVTSDRAEVELTATVLGPPVADAGGPYSGRRGRAIEFDGTHSYDQDGTIESYAWEFGDDKTGTGPTPSHTYSSVGEYTVTLTVTDNDGLTDTDETTVYVSRTPSPPPVNKKPKADAGPNQKTSVDNVIHFSGVGSYDPDGEIVIYRWSFGDGMKATGSEVSHSYSELGHYTVTLTVKDSRGAEDSDTCIVKVWEPPVPVRNRFGELVHGGKKGHVVDAMDEANTTVTLDTTDNVTVTILRYEENPYPGDPIPAMALPTYVDVEVSNPDAVVWPIYVEVSYTDEQIGELDESTFGIYYWFNGTWQRCSDTGVYTDRNVVWAYMTAEEASGSPILIAGIHAIITPPLPPFLDNLAVTPLELELGDNVTVSLDIMNPNDGDIGYGFDMEIGDLTLKIWVDLGAYESKTVSRTITPTEVGTHNVTVIGMTGSFTVKAPPKPAEFVVSDLSITPEEFELGEGVDVWSFRITVDVANVGEQEGTHKVDLKVDGEVIQAGTVILFGGEETSIIFDVTRGVGVYAVEVDGLTGSFTVKAHPKPPEFEVSELTITPEEVEPGDGVTISVLVTNIGEETGDYTVTLDLPVGPYLREKTVSLEGGESERVEFEVSRDIEGTYAVTVDGLTGSFTVTEPPTVPVWWMQPGYMAGILILVASAGAVIYYAWKAKLFSPIFSGSK